jgi:hypothetical protein
VSEMSENGNDDKDALIKAGALRLWQPDYLTQVRPSSSNRPATRAARS